MPASVVDPLPVTAPYYQQAGINFEGDEWNLDAFIEQRRAQARKKARYDESIPKTTVESLTDLAAEPYVEPTEQHARKQDDIARKYLKAFRAAKARIMELKDDARAEGYGVSAASENDLLAFLNGRVFTRRPFITLLDNGNLRALWKNAEGEQIGLQFRGGKQVQYVLFARRKDEGFMARASGRDSLAGIERQIEAHNLGRLMTA